MEEIKNENEQQKTEEKPKLRIKAGQIKGGFRGSRYKFNYRQIKFKDCDKEEKKGR